MQFKTFTFSRLDTDNQTLFGRDFMEMILSPRLSFLRGVLANQLASTDNLTGTTKRQSIYQLKLTIPVHKNGP